MGELKDSNWLRSCCHEFFAARLALAAALILLPGTANLGSAQTPDTSATAGQPPASSSASELNAMGKLANTQIQANDYAAAIATYLSILSKVTNSRDRAEVWARLGDAYRRKGDFANAIHATEESLALAPVNAPLITTLGLLYEQQDDLPHARQYYERAISIDPTNPLALNNLAYILARTGGDLTLALSYAQTAHQKFPESSEIDDTLGSIYLKKNMSIEATDQFKIAIAADPKKPDYHYHYALALSQLGDQARAVEECRKALANKPQAEMEKEIRSLLEKLAPQMDTRPPAVLPAK